MSHLLSSYNHPVLREYAHQLPTLAQLIYPLFVSDLPNETTPMESLPGQKRYGYLNVAEAISPLVKQGMRSVLVFGVLVQQQKDSDGSMASSPDGPTQRAVHSLRKRYSRDQLLIITDCCLCSFRADGNCGVFVEKGGLFQQDHHNYQSDLVLDNDASQQQMVRIALSQAQAGADVVAPSDMMQGRIAAIRQAFQKNNYQTTIMSYASKFASSFYGPFRQVCDSAPSVGHRRDYQLPQGSGQLAERAALQDYQSGADFIIVKPGMPYLDVIQRLKSNPNILCQLAAYQVSGEYAMIHAAAEKGVIDKKAVLMELLTSFKRAGADLVITYFVPELLEYYGS